ncbi:MAG: cytochrome c [Bacteroidetes bacterium]|nr:cytochrome c [Bacteroidota bacterium]
MRRLKKILKWTGIALLLLVATIVLVVLCRQNLHYSAPYPDITASTDSTVIERGKHLVFGPAHCINCHNNSNPDSLIEKGLPVSLSGGFAFRLPVGTIYSRNITPDKETGIGNFTDSQIARALRYGVHPDGTAVYDFMPFHNMSDEDLRAVISYLRSQKPVSNPVPSHELNTMGHLVKAFLIKPVGPEGTPPASVKEDSTAAYGKYLALSVAECSSCHTKRDLSGAYLGEPFAGGNEIEGYMTPNLTPDSSGRIARWTQQDFIARFRKGRLVPGSPMPWNAFGRMSDTELKAIYNYLRTVKPAKTPTLH